MIAVRKNPGLVAIVLVLVLVLVASSCAPAAEKEKEITIGLHGILTGAAATLFVPANYGQLDYMYLKRDQGGIEGVPLNIIWEDTAGLIPRVVSSYKRFGRAGAVLQLVNVTSQTEVLAPRCQKDEVPLIYGLGPSHTPGMLTKPIHWVVAGTPGNKEEVARSIKWFADRWTEARPMRVGAILCDTAGCYEISHDMFPEPFWEGQMGNVEVVGVEVLPFLGVIDASVELLRLAANEPDLIFVGQYGGAMVTATHDIARLELREKGIEFLCHQPCLDESIMNIVGKEGTEGLYRESPLPIVTESELPGMKTVIEAAQQYRGYTENEITMVYIAGWISTMVGIEAIRLALEKVGFENLTGKDVRDELMSLQAYETGLVPPITTSESKPCFFDSIRILQVRDGKFESVSDWLKVPVNPELKR